MNVTGRGIIIIVIIIGAAKEHKGGAAGQLTSQSVAGLDSAWAAWSK